MVYTCGSAQRDPERVGVHVRERAEGDSDGNPAGRVRCTIDSQSRVSQSRVRHSLITNTRLRIAIDSARRVRHHSNRAKFNSKVPPRVRRPPRAVCRWSSLCRAGAALEAVQAAAGGSISEGTLDGDTRLDQAQAQLFARVAALWRPHGALSRCTLVAA